MSAPEWFFGTPAVEDGRSVVLGDRLSDESSDVTFEYVEDGA